MRVTAVLVVAAVVAAAVGAPAAGALADTNQQPTTAEPGSRLAGVIGVQQAEVEANIDRRVLDRRFGAANSNASKAALVAEQATTSRERLAAVRERLATLRAQRANGDISESEYRARVAPVAARVAAVQRSLNRTERVSRTVPAATLERNGVNATELRRLRTAAGEVGGPEVARIAREVAGPRAGAGLTGPPADAGPPANRGGNETGPPGDRGGNETGPS